MHFFIIKDGISVASCFLIAKNTLSYLHRLTLVGKRLSHASVEEVVHAASSLLVSLSAC